jgi:hypothetical protein
MPKQPDDIAWACRIPIHKVLNMPMTAAYTLLGGKRCRFVSDKLAILGNLTGYPIRINSDHVVDRNLSFSACAIAMALYNGDLSLVFC